MTELSFTNPSHQQEVPILSQYWGLQEYSVIEEVQHNISKVIEPSGNLALSILGGEFFPVVTLGTRAAKLNSEMSVLPEILQAKKYRVFQSTRGGLVTLHNPGQLVIYPVVNISAHGFGVKKYVEILLLSTVDTLSLYNISAWVDLKDNPGVHTNQGKIAFCGLKVSRGVSTHGISVNLLNDIGDFAGITPCGFQNLKITSVQRLVENPEKFHASDIFLQSFFTRWVDIFSQRVLQSSGPWVS